MPTLPLPQPSTEQKLTELEIERNIKLDEFQKNAILYLEQGCDVLVSAPTGSGKTLIAEYRIKEILNRKGKVWYASPLKALSNDKYRDFKGLFGKENVGILTGDRKENSTAPILVGTTEIFRNILIDEGLESSPHVDLIVFDEAHWLKDQERGVTWEEAIIFAPKTSQLLFLSATFPNVEEIALWLSSVREKEIKIVYKVERPIPLLWYSIGKNLKPLFKGDYSNLATKIEYKEIYENSSEFSITRSIEILAEQDLTPAIFFFSSRKECENLALEVKNLIKQRKIKIKEDPYEVKKRAEFCSAYLELFPYIKGNPLVSNFIESGVAPHHAGLLPALKILFEDALKYGLAKFIFSTKTLASGIDVPAKSVVIASKFTFDGKHERLLTPGEIMQMAGRAGRRGKDEIGYVFISAPISREEVQKLFGEVEKITSNFYITPHLVLNLLKKVEPSECIQLIRKSLKYFEISQTVANWKEKKAKLEERIQKLNEEFNEIKPKNCSPYTKISFLNTKKNLEETETKISEISAVIKVMKTISDQLLNNNNKITSVSGFAIDTKGKFGILIPQGNFFSFTTLEKTIFLKESEIKNRIRHIFTIEDIPILYDIKFVKSRILCHFSKSYPNLYALKDKIRNVINNLERINENLKSKNANRQKELENLPCVDCSVYENCSKLVSELEKLNLKMQKIERENPDKLEKEFWGTLKFLRELSYLNQAYVLTEKGWEASKLKNPRSIYIFEIISKNLIGQTPEDLAATVALILSEPKPPFRPSPKGIEKLFEQIYNLEIHYGISPKVKPVEIWKSKRLKFLDGRIYYATLLWAKGYEIDYVEQETEIEPGDLARMVIQTTEVLRQISTIYNFKHIAEEAIRKIYRSPISDFIDI